MSRFINFDDRSEKYVGWKTSFCAIMTELNVSLFEELDMLSRESARHATSIQAAHLNNPQRELERIWERLYNLYESAAMIKKALKNKHKAFLQLIKRENMKGFELVDILSEIETVKEDPKYSPLLGYFDSSSLVTPIINKWHYELRDKWVSLAFRFKKENNVVFPPFSVLVSIIT